MAVGPSRKSGGDYVLLPCRAVYKKRAIWQRTLQPRRPGAPFRYPFFRGLIALYSLKVSYELRAEEQFIDTETVTVGPNDRRDPKKLFDFLQAKKRTDGNQSTDSDFQEAGIN